MKKNLRQEALIRIIENNVVSTQEQLLEKLLGEGYKVTQATISRDIKALNLIKTQSENGLYKYSVVNNENKNDKNNFSILSHCVLNVDYAQNITVLRCNPGMANAACASIDGLENSEIVGTIAGDDTVFILCRSQDDAVKLSEKILELI